MAIESSVNDVFRFMQLRPMRAVDPAASIALVRDTKLATAIAGAAGEQRTALANAFLEKDGDAVGSLAGIPFGPETAAAIAELRGDPDATTKTLLDSVGHLGEAMRDHGLEPARRALSDTLLAAFYATKAIPRELRAFQDVYRVYTVLTTGDHAPLTTVLRLPLLAPAPPPPPQTSTGREQRAIPTEPDTSIEAEALDTAIEELARLDRSEWLVQPDEDGKEVSGRGKPFTLVAAARARISKETATLLAERGIDLSAAPLDTALHALMADLGKLPTKVKWPRRPPVVPQPGVTLPPAPAHALIRPAGIADLLVVKQQIKRYEAGEIAHVENVLIGETKSRAHRRLERSEETFVSETEQTRTQETEIETADRFELNRETSRTIKEDQQVSLGLSLSGKYGPSIEFSSNFELDRNTSSEETSKSSSKYAKDVVSRSLERVTERVREMRTRTVIRETEETNLHELKNETDAHVRGVYQFLDKVYETQVFNYGLREMFDFMVPEPASFLWYMEQNPHLDLQLPPPVPDLALVAPDASHISEGNALELAATYGATVEMPPPLYRVLTAGTKHGEDNASEEGQPNSIIRIELQVPAGYRPKRARIRAVALTDDDPMIAVMIGNRRALWFPSSMSSVGSGHSLGHQPELALNLDDEPFEMAPDAKLAVSVMAWETNTYNVDVTIVAVRTAEELARWRLATYGKIRAAYDDSVRRYNQRVEELRAEAEARAERESRRPFGAPPAENKRTIRTELRKHCISIITQQRYDAFDATKNGTPPFFDFVEAAAEGAYIRFFEQAFEWDQLQYVFYPYFWARKAWWIDRLSRQDIDPEYVEFLRAGAARVVVPVRPGFETAVTHFLETGKIWGGEGEPPLISSPLYVSIIEEIQERTGAPQGEIAVGDPWDARVPTALLLARAEEELPRWERVTPGSWDWRPVTGGS